MIKQKQGADNIVVLRPGAHIHLVGIGGAGISAIARVLLDRRFVVSGSDMQNSSEFLQALRADGATVHIGHAASNIEGAEIVIISSAIPSTNPEVVAAKAANIPVLKRSDFLGHLMANQVGVAIAGTHGKTTTTSMIAHILIEAGLDPTVVVGGVLPTIGSNAQAGSGEHFVIEADEYDNMFLGLRPQVAVINNIEHDHPDIFDSAESYLAAFQKFALLLPAAGQLIANADDENVMSLIENLDAPFTIQTFGLNADADLRAEQLQPNQLGGVDFLVMARNAGQQEVVGLARMRVPGEHNVRNALAAIAIALNVGVEFDKIQQALGSFGGVGRRFQEIGTVGGVTIIDDYAHHPTEIRATLAAARQRFNERTVWAVWQPHTYSRTKLLMKEFVSAFDDADRVVVLDIYRSRERDTLGIDSGKVVDAMTHPYVRYVGSNRAAAAYILDRVRPNDVLLTLGAGDGDEVGRLVLKGLEDRLANH